MSTLMTLVAKITADIADFKTKMKDVESTAQSVSNKTKDWGAKMSLGITAPVVGMAVLATKAASDTSESYNKMNVVFGESTDQMKKFADSAAQNLGLSRQEAMETSGTFGNLFTALGLGQSDAAGLSQKVLTLGADLASFNNIGVPEALEKIRAGLIGESEPLRSLGVNLTEAGVKAKAMQMGLVDANGEVTNQGKVMARWALIMEQTKTAQGDFARTSDGLANSQRILSAEFKDAIADLGTQFLPIALQLVGILREAIKWISGLPGPVKQGILMFVLLAAAIGPLLMIISAVTGAISAIGTVITFVGGATFAAIAPVILIVLAVVAAIALLYIAWTNNWGGIQQKVAAVVTWISTAVQNFITGITAWWNSGTNTLRIVWEGVWNVISTIVTTFVQYIKLLIQAFSYAVSGDWYKFGQTLRQAWDLIWNAILSILKNIWGTIKSVISAAIQNVISFFKNTNWSQVGRDIINGIVNGLKSAAGWLADAARNAAQAALDAAKGFLGIHSPSKKFETQVGWQMGMGTLRGFQNSMKRVVNAAPGMFDQMLAQPIPVSSGASRVTGTAPVYVAFSYAPTVSLGDRYEAEQVMAPIVASRVREELAKRGK